jgi:NADPH:quinone reductase-like Zn-dependent oxidoreductase
VPTVFRSTIIDAPIETVWSWLRDFNGHERWHPAVEESHIEGVRAADQVGAVRTFRLATGAQLREQLLRLSDRDRSFTYCILDSPIPLIGYVASVTLKRVTDGNRTFWNWHSTFSTPPGLEPALERLVGEEIYERGFAAIRALASARMPEPVSMPPRARFAPRTKPGSIRCSAVAIDRYGGPDVLKTREIEVPPPGPGEVRVRHTAIGVNYIDINIRAGHYSQFPVPLTPGVEAAGEVVDVGEGVVGILPGDRVGYAALPPGAYCQYRNMAVYRLVVLPASVSDEAAAALLLKGMTAEYLLRRAHRVRRGDFVLIHSAAGATGLLLCQWAKRLGASVIGTVSNEAKARIAREHGCEYPIVHTREDFVGQVRSITGGHGADVVFDGVGRDTLTKSLEALALRGHLVSYGQSSGSAEPIDIAVLTPKSARLSRPVLFHYIADPAELRASAQRVFDLLARGVLKASVNHRHALAEAAQAHRDLEARRTSGAKVLTP